MLTTPRLLTFATAGLLGLAVTTSALQSTAERTLLVAVWAEDGQILTEDTEVAATSRDGAVKGTLEASGHFVLPEAGVPTDYGLKATLEVVHPFYGTHLVDVRLAAATTNTIDLMFDFDGELSAHGASILETPEPAATPSYLGGSGGGDCASATEVAPVSITSGNTSGAPLAFVDDCGTSITSSGLWFKVVGTGNTMTASTCSPFTFYDTKLSVFCGDCEGLNCIGGNDDAFNCTDFQSEVSWCSQPGATYYVLVHGFDDDAGEFELVMSDDGAPCDTAVACLPTGACCVDGACSILTPPACADAGGDYKGDFSECNVTIGTREYKSGLLNADIPDFDPTGVSHSIEVPLDFRVADLDVGLFVNHTFTGDLQVFLEHNGTEVLIVDRPLFPELAFGCGEDNWTGIILDDEGEGGSIENQCQVGGNLTSPPSFTPANALSAFDGGSSAGTWTLRIVDNANLDTGSLVAWRLYVSRGNGATTCNFENPENAK